MKKTELYTQVSGLIAQYAEQFKSKKAFNEFSAEIDKLIKPKSGGGIVKNPAIEVDGITYHHCRYTQYYLPESEMVMSNGKSKGYSKKAIALWTKLGKEALSLNEQAMKLLLADKIQEGTELAQKAEELKTLRNSPESYDQVRKEYAEIRLQNA